MLTIGTEGFLKYLQGTKGITITQLADYANIATNLTQKIRQPYKKAQIYTRTFRPTGFSKEENIPGFVPNISGIYSDVVREGQYNAFNELATKIIEAHKQEKHRIATIPWEQILDFEPFKFSGKERLDELLKEITALDLERPKPESLPKPIEKNEAKNIIDFLDEGELFDYLLANQTASAYGNLILADPEKSRDPRNFLYQIFEQEYVAFTKGDTLFTPYVTGENYTAYQDAFFDVQSKHREQEKNKNYFKVKHQTYENDLKSEELDQYKQDILTYELEQNKLTTKYNEDFANWTSKRKTLVDEYNTLIAGQNIEIANFNNSRQSEAEQRRKQVEIEFYSRRVWLPEKARQITQLMSNAGSVNAG